MDKTSPVYVTEEGYKQYLLALEDAKKTIYGNFEN